MSAIKLNSIVTFITPEEGEGFQPYKVIEDNEDRVQIEPVYWRYEIKPVSTVLKSDLRLAFREHTDILVPDFLEMSEDGPWYDSSWHNDETASAHYVLNDQYSICLWVWDANYDDAGKYTVCFIDTKHGWMSYGIQCRTDEEAVKAIEDYKQNWQTAINTEDWM